MHKAVEYIGQPWPIKHPGSVLFLLDAGHRVERKLLEDWLQSSRTSVEFNGEVKQLVVPIAATRENIPWQALAAELENDADNTLLVPLRVVWLSARSGTSSTPRLRDLLYGNPRRPGTLRAAQLLQQQPERVKCIAGEPATLAALKLRFTEQRVGAMPVDELAGFIARQAGLALDIAERRLQGGRYKVPRYVAQSLQSSPRFNQTLQQLSAEVGKPVAELRLEANTYMKELISIPRTFWLDVMSKLNHLICRLGYEADIVCDRDELARVRQLVRENPAAILWTHKTHVDGFAINSILFDNDFPSPHILGGVNMAFAGLGFVARRAGAIFIRRSFQDNPLYKIVLRQYIGYLMEKRFPLTWAFEGTRSRVGKLMPPRYGLLKYVLEAAHATEAKNLHIIPVSISYDLIGDVADYATEQAGAKKQPESLRWFVGYLSGLRQPLGRIYVEFGQPVVLPDVPSAEDPITLAKIAFEVGVQANKVTPITLPSLACMCLLGAAPQALTATELMAGLNELLHWARTRHIKLTSDFDPENSQQLDAIADVMVAGGVLTRYDEGPERVYGLTPEQHGVASYYRNTIIHHFVIKAIAELALLRAVTAPGESTLSNFWDEAERLRDLFKFEFFYAPGEEFRAELKQELNRYSPSWETDLLEKGEGLNILIYTLRPFVAHATLLPLVEAYLVVADVIARLDEDQTIDEKTLVSQALKYGRQAYLQRRISSEAAIGKLLFQNGYKLMENRGLVLVGEPELGARRKQFAVEMRDLSRRIERIRARAMSG